MKKDMSMLCPKFQIKKTPDHQYLILKKIHILCLYRHLHWTPSEKKIETAKPQISPSANNNHCQSYSWINLENRINAVGNIIFPRLS